MCKDCDICGESVLIYGCPTCESCNALSHESARITDKLIGFIEKLPNLAAAETINEVHETINNRLIDLYEIDKKLENRKKR